MKGADERAAIKQYNTTVLHIMQKYSSSVVRNTKLVWSPVKVSVCVRVCVCVHVDTVNTFILFW